MFDILLVSHGPVAQAMLDAAAMVYGPSSERAAALCFEPGQSQQELLASITDAIDNAKDNGGLLVICDILGGSPFLMSAQAYQNIENRASLEVITGMNLAMIIEAMVCRESASLQEAKEAIVASGMQSIVDFAAQMN